jgi:hypothetical protein
VPKPIASLGAELILDRQNGRASDRLVCAVRRALVLVWPRELTFSMKRNILIEEEILPVAC